MSVEKLQARVELLKAEVTKAQSNVALLKEQLEKSEAHVHMVIGHMNEAIYQLQESIKDAGGVELPIVPSEPLDQLEDDCGEINIESSEQVAK